MINFKPFLVESRSAPLYHGTFGDAVYNILLRNGIKPKTSQRAWKLGYPPDRFSDHKSMISGVSLSRSFKFAASYGSGYVLELDQRRLAQNYKIVPFQFWQEHPRLSGARMPPNMISKQNEFEEFVITNQPIPASYIVKLYYPLRWDQMFKQGDILQEKVFIDAIQNKYGSSFIRTY